MNDQRGIFETVIGDGRPLLLFTGLSLVLAGAFALFLAATGQFLPHDAEYLGLSAEELCRFTGCRIVAFMIHDRVAFGGSLISIGVLYMWLAEFPLRQGEGWAWWTFLLSGAIGFGSFLAYLGYGYLDTWHGVATLFLFPCFVVGLSKSYRLIQTSPRISDLRSPAVHVSWRSAEGIGRASLLLMAAGLVGSGITILLVGMTIVFVPQDLTFMMLRVDDFEHINPRLVPLIAHDRAGFGGGLCASGVAMFFSVWCGTPSRSLWQILCLAGGAGFGCAIGIHFIVGYTDFIHLLPAYLGAIIYTAGLVFKL
ncbi:MAG: hypothetical protein AAF485_08765 [Chloroflexota bacterium]